MANLNKQSTLNPFDLVHVLEFQLRLVSEQTVLTIEEDRLPKILPPVNDDDASEMSDMPGLLAEVDEM